MRNHPQREDPPIDQKNPCETLNCVCSGQPGWPKRPVAGYMQHLHAELPRVVGNQPT